MITHDIFKEQQPPPPDTAMGQHYYAYLCLKNMLEGGNVEPPDPSRCNGSFHALNAVYKAYQDGGRASAIGVWAMLKAGDWQLEHYEEPLPMVINVADLHYYPSPKYLLDAYPLYARGLNILFGASGSGKSFIALDIAARLSASQKVMYVATEGLHGFGVRWEAWKAHNQPDYYPDLFFYMEELQVLNRDELNLFIAANKDEKPALVIIDTFARSAVGVEENSSRDMGLYLAATDRIRDELDCAVLIVHHTNKSGGIRGSSALYAAADSVMALTKEKDLITLYNTHDEGGKNRYKVQMPPKYYHLEEFDVEVENESGEMEILSGAILKESDQKMTKRVKLKKLTLQQKMVLKALNEADGGLKPMEVQRHTQIPKRTIYRVLNQLKETAYVVVEDDKYELTQSGLKALS